jgi:putative transposase
MVTAATLRKELLFRGAERLTLLEDRLLSFAKKYNWQLEAWAVFPNHYHFVARSEDGAVDLKRFVIHLHADTARELNRLDQCEGRKVWYNFWDTKLTYPGGVLGPRELCTPKCCEAWPGSRRESVRLVLGGVV